MATTYEPETDAPIRPSAPSRPATPAKPKSSRRTVFIIMGVVLFFLVLFGARKWWFSRSHVSTDNAQVDGHILPILPKVGGYVAEVRVDENQNVKAGDTLVVACAPGCSRPTPILPRCSRRSARAPASVRPMRRSLRRRRTRRRRLPISRAPSTSEER